MSTATLTWTVPTTRTDGSSLDPNDIASIDILDDLNDGSGPFTIGSVSGAGTSFTTGLLTVGLHNFSVLVNDTTGHVSAQSNIAQLDVPATQAAPSAVTDLAATLNP